MKSRNRLHRQECCTENTCPCAVPKRFRLRTLRRNKIAENTFLMRSLITGTVHIAKDSTGLNNSSSNPQPPVQQLTNKEAIMHFTRRYFLRLLAAASFAGAIPAAIAAEAPRVSLKTSMGEIVLELHADKAPKSVANFLEYVKSGHYNGTIFHRVINGFMIQGGGYDKNMAEKPTRPPIENEAKNGLKNEPYTLAMARTPAPHSASAQFFINVKNNSFLDYPGQDGWGYAVFGRVIKGMEVVDKIKAVPTGANDIPAKPVVIESATVIK
jgi:cyclophilin family peptidyl-prolyl cis-trans isomerase